ncbi:hypothetical protein GOD68_33965 [Sinorhizobium medicae]|nr:hypothetical protein [Sinorhizobium medicae]MDX0673951.1 hypothetical protein [Sinorhizobium medicae]MDX0711098.1 hypothetical protein [Sinorhizobium medicae]
MAQTLGGATLSTAFFMQALELGPAKFCHPVKNTDADLCFSLLIVKMSRFEFGDLPRVISSSLD